MRIHLIAIGGSIMHNLAIALKQKEYVVSGSDDEIYEPSYSLLKSHGILPKTKGWDTSRITPDIDLIILGMHARKDNPELLEGIRLGIPIKSFPEFIASHFRDKTRIVVAGSHGKTTTSSMIMHAFNAGGYPFDYLVGARLQGFDTMVSIGDAPLAVLEGDEYLSSALDPRPKFLHYAPQIAIITGIAWDHMNVFPTYESYVEQFRLFLQSMSEGSKLIYYAQDADLGSLIASDGSHLDCIPYQAMPYDQDRHGPFVSLNGRDYRFSFLGRHNFENMKAASLVCAEAGMSEEQFLRSMETFQGASKRLEKVFETSGGSVVFRDFAHAPSKLQATVSAIRERYQDYRIVAFYELHTFSSLNKAFLPQYEGTLSQADRAIVYFNPDTVARKKLPPLDADQVGSVFGVNKPEVYTSTDSLQSALLRERGTNTVFLWMSSGHFDGLDIRTISKSILQ